MNMKFKVYRGTNTNGEKVFFAKSDDGLFFAVVPESEVNGKLRRAMVIFSHPVIWTSSEPEINNLEFVEAGEVIDFY